MRSIALDVHRDFCEVAIKDESGLRLAGRVRSSVSELELFAQSLAPDDEVALEATGGALQIARILEGHVARVVIANTRKLSAIAESKVKTDKVDAKTLCELLAAGFLPAVFSPDEFTRALRRRLQRRSKLVRSRTRAKNECHAVLARNLNGRPPMTDVFGKAGRSGGRARAGMGRGRKVRGGAGRYRARVAGGLVRGGQDALRGGLGGRQHRRGVERVLGARARPPPFADGARRDRKKDQRAFL